MGREYTDQAQFNLGLLYLQGSYSVLRSISTAFMNSDRHKALLGLRTLYREIACKLKQPEREHVAKMFTKMNPYLRQEAILKKNLQKSTSFDEKIEIKSKIAQNSNSIFKSLEDIDIVIRDYLEKKGLLIPNKKDMTRFENLE